jgi:hypothetical protein
VLDQSLKEHRAGAPGRPLEDRPQRGELIAVQIGAAVRIRLGDSLVPVTAGSRFWDDPAGGVAVESIAPSLTLVLPIAAVTLDNTTSIETAGLTDRLPEDQLSGRDPGPSTALRG